MKIPRTTPISPVKSLKKIMRHLEKYLKVSKEYPNRVNIYKKSPVGLKNPKNNSKSKKLCSYLKNYLVNTEKLWKMFFSRYWKCRKEIEKIPKNPRKILKLTEKSGYVQTIPATIPKGLENSPKKFTKAQQKTENFEIPK